MTGICTKISCTASYFEFYYLYKFTGALYGFQIYKPPEETLILIMRCNKCSNQNASIKLE